MDSIPLDTSERLVRLHSGVRWTFAYLPLGKDEELRATIADAYKPILDARPAEGDESAEAKERHQAALAAQRPALRATALEVVRWGVAGWSLSRLPATKESVSYAGVTYEVLAR